MIALTVLCEGQSEAAFVNSVLYPHLVQFQVFPKPQPVTRRNYGTVPYDTFRKAVQAEIGRSRAHEFTTTMIDLYGLRGFPEQGRQPDETPHQRVARIEAAMANKLPNPRFIPYIQLHEFEALIYVDLDQVPPSFPDTDVSPAINRLKAEVAGIEPELIDDGGATSPSKRLVRHVPVYDPLKHVVGPQIAGRIGIERLRARCPHFAMWLSSLELLGRPSSD